MKCEFAYCIYNRASECILDEIEITYLGMCNSCMILFLGADVLEREKGRQLQEIEDRWAEMNQ